MPDCDAVRRAVESYGRAPKDKRGELRRSIIREATRLHCTQHIPDEWEIR